jgi:hypothetical protein
MFLSHHYYFLVTLAFIEAFSIYFSTVTISNRISINLLAGSLLIYIITVATRLYCSSILLIPFLCTLVTTFIYEQANALVQMLIYLLLSTEYVFITAPATFDTAVTRAQLETHTTDTIRDTSITTALIKPVKYPLPLMPV